jgi:hypothetical protein
MGVYDGAPELVVEDRVELNVPDELELALEAVDEVTEPVVEAEEGLEVEDGVNDPGSRILEELVAELLEDEVENGSKLLVEEEVPGLLEEEEISVTVRNERVPVLLE